MSGVRLRVTRRELQVPRWPFDGLRVAMISDLHAGAPGVGLETVERAVRLVDHADPDLVALLGDYVDPTVTGADWIAPELVADRLRALRAPTFAVVGNHDWMHEGERVARTLDEAGVTLLENAALEQRPGLWVAGVSDLSTRVPRVGETLREVPETAACLLLAHDPNVFPEVPPRVSLTLAGHTHGGQVHVPVLWRLWTPGPYRGGHMVEDGRHLYVSRGIGFSRLPVRWRVPSELVVLTLRSPA